MTKVEYLKHFFETKAYGSKAAIQSLIGIQFEDEESSGEFKKIPGAIFVEKGKFFTIIDGTTVEVDEEDTGGPFCYMDERFDFPADFHPILKGQEIYSTFGLMLFNIVLFWEPFGPLVDYVNKPFTKKIIQGIIGDLMVDNPAEGETVPEGKASVDQCLKFTENCYFLEGLNIHFVKPGGVDTLVVHPDILKRKAELLEEHKHELSDPVVFTAILDELVDMDRKIQMSGPSKNFFINDKFISNARKRMFLAFGIEPDSNEENWVPLPNSLDEGIDHTQIVTYINTSVAGSYSRSKATGEGGSQVKETLRLIGRASRTEEDCKTPVGELKILDELEAPQWVGGYYIGEDGSAVEITKDGLKGLIGKPIKLRVPSFCQTPDGNYCRVCLGDSLGKYAQRLTADVTRVPTNWMLSRMKAHHTAGNKNVKLNLKRAIK